LKRKKIHLKEKGGLNANKGKYGVLYSFLRNQERNTNISRTHPRFRAYRWDKHLRAKDYQ
jgi:hypothetical protein